MSLKFFLRFPILLLACILCSGGVSAQFQLADAANFKTSWRGGFDRYDFLMDTATLQIRPIRTDSSEHFGMSNKVKGSVRCILIVPKQAAAGRPWCWRGFYWDHEPQYEVELLKRGFYIGYVNCDPGPQWEAWYKFLKSQGLSSKPAFGGMSRGGINAYAWSTSHLSAVSCIYGDNPAIRPEDMGRMAELAKRNIPLLNICGSQDFLYEKNTLPIETIYHQAGGRITVIIKEGTAHHPHSLQNPKIIADWIVENSSPSVDRPEFIDSTFIRSSYYSLKKSLIYLNEEKTYAACSGPDFTPCYERFDVKNQSFYGISSLAIIIPLKPAPGRLWVFCADRLDRDAALDQELLARGYYIVVTPLTAQSGAVEAQWTAVYRMLTEHGFSKKTALEGTGASAGECFAWAISNPEKVSCIYSVNPVLHSLMKNSVLIDSLAPLAKAGVPLLSLCGSQDPWFKDNTGILEKKYKALGGHIQVSLVQGEGHFLRPKTTEALGFFKRYEK